jgi:hypothetical protein
MRREDLTKLGEPYAEQELRLLDSRVRPLEDRGEDPPLRRSPCQGPEGVIYHARDARKEQQPIREKGQVVGYEPVTVDAGEPDKRLLVIEPELAVLLKSMAREGNSLSGVIRDAWDTGDKASAIAHKANDEGLSLREAALKLGYVDSKRFDEIVDPKEMVGHGAEGA